MFPNKSNNCNVIIRKLNTFRKTLTLRGYNLINCLHILGHQFLFFIFQLKIIAQLKDILVDIYYNVCSLL